MAKIVENRLGGWDFGGHSDRMAKVLAILIDSLFGNNTSIPSDIQRHLQINERESLNHYEL